MAVAVDKKWVHEEKVLPSMYTIEAWYPNTTVPPDREYMTHYADLIDRVIQLAYGGDYTTVVGRTPDGLVLIQMWGQLAGMP